MRSVVLLALLAGCVDTPRFYEPEVESSHVEIREIPGSRVPKHDVLIVLDETTLATAAYHDRLAQLPALIETAIERQSAGWTDLHVAVTGNDGWLRRLPGAPDTFLARSIDFAYARSQNYEGTLRDALATLMTIDDASDGPTQPLAAMRHALETGGQFFRDDASLGIVIVSANDDASPLSAADYATWTWALRDTHWQKIVSVSAVIARPAPRLEEYLQTAMPLGGIASIDASDYGPALTQLVNGWGWGGEPCLDGAPVDADPQTEGMQYDCSLSVMNGDVRRAVPVCADSEPGNAPLPAPACFSLVSDAQNCFYTDGRKLQLHGYTERVHPAFRLECRTR